MGLRKKIAIGAIALVGAIAATVPGLAQEAGDDLNSREQREQVREDAAAAAEQLDAALAEDAALEEALEQLDANVELKREQAEASGRALAAARREVAATEERIAKIEADIAGVRSEADKSAVMAYIESSGVRIGDLFEADHFNELGSKEALGANLRRSHTDVVDDLRIREEFLRLERDALTNAQEQLEGRKQTQDQRLRQVEKAQRSREILRAKLATRISDFQAEVDALDIEEDRLTAQIRSEDQVIIDLAAAEAKRRETEAAAARAAAQAEASSSSSSDSSSSSIAISSGDGMVWPVQDPRVTSEYGPRWGRMHKGIDIAAPTGTEIFAADSGTVITSRWYGGYGNAVVIDHGNGFVTLYGHMTHDDVSEGQTVSKGQLIGWMGCTGSCTGPHTHFEVRVNGDAHDPRSYLP